MNDKPCKDCENFDVIIRGKKETAHGWCAKKSKYPHMEGPGQVFPAGVQRVAKGEMALPVIVRANSVESRCTMYRPKRAKQSKRDLIKKVQSKGGKVVLT